LLLKNFLEIKSKLTPTFTVGEVVKAIEKIIAFFSKLGYNKE